MVRSRVVVLALFVICAARKETSGTVRISLQTVDIRCDTLISDRLAFLHGQPQSQPTMVMHGSLPMSRSRLAFIRSGSFAEKRQHAATYSPCRAVSVGLTPLKCCGSVEEGKHIAVSKVATEGARQLIYEPYSLLISKSTEATANLSKHPVKGHRVCRGKLDTSVRCYMQLLLVKIL
jgi:hypothetical protein